MPRMTLAFHIWRSLVWWTLVSVCRETITYPCIFASGWIVEVVKLFKSSRFVEPEAFGSRRTEKTWLSAWWLQFGSFSDFPSPEWFMARNAEVLDHIHLPALLHLVSFYGMWPYCWAIFRFFYESMSRQVAKLTRAIRVVIQFNMSGYTVCFSKYHDTSLYILTLEERKYIMQDVFDYKNKIRF